jgi:hypothetical protein
MSVSWMLLLLPFCGPLPGCSQTKIDDSSVAAPTPTVLQEMHDLRARRTRLEIRKRYLGQSAERAAQQEAPGTRELRQFDDRLNVIAERLETIHKSELGQFERVAEQAVLLCNEEPMYGQSSYGIILHAVAVRPIETKELLLFHAGGVYRTSGTFQKLTTTGVGWYFRPNAPVLKGEKFVVACIQDAPEEIQNVKNGFMPDSNRARDPSRPYRTQLFGSDDQPIPPGGHQISAIK